MSVGVVGFVTNVVVVVVVVVGVAVVVEVVIDIGGGGFDKCGYGWICDWWWWWWRGLLWSELGLWQRGLRGRRREMSES